MLKIKGFTLIELLVVMSIIGILAAIVVVSVNPARARARDTKRKADLRTLQTAMESYYYKNNQSYIPGKFISFNPTGYTVWNTGLQPLVDNNFLPGPLNMNDPTNKQDTLNVSNLADKTNFGYLYYGKADSYLLGTNLEQSTDFTKKCGNLQIKGGKGDLSSDCETNF